MAFGELWDKVMTSSSGVPKTKTRKDEEKEEPKPAPDKKTGADVCGYGGSGDACRKRQIEAQTD